MADAKAEAIVYTFKTPITCGFINVLTARKYMEAGKEVGEPKFDATMILEPDSADLVALKDLCITMAKGMYPGKRLVARRLTQEELNDGGVVEVSMPWSDGTKQADDAKNANPPKDREFFRDKIVLKANSKFAPALSGIEGGKVISYTNPETRATLDKIFYSGAYLVPHVQLHSYKARDQKPGGVSLWLNAVCFVKHGTRLTGGGNVNAAEVFSQFAGTVSAEDPTAGSKGDEL